MINIICGTNRRESVSKKIAIQYQEILRSEGEDAEIIDLNLLPPDFIVSALYENRGKNEEFNTMVGQLKTATKFVFIVAEYNGSFPGVLKTFIDGLPYREVFNHKKGALVGISSGTQGGGLALSHLTDILNYMGMHVLAYKTKFANIERLIHTDKIIDKAHLDKLIKQAKMLIEF
jgi:NAD(P)H-dependent FMN reductase